MKKLPAFLFALCSTASAGWLTQDQPAEVMRDKSVEHYEVIIDKSVSQVASRLKAMHVLCSPGQTINDNVEDQHALMVVWLTRQTISHVIELEGNSESTKMVVYMNKLASKQRVVWPLLVREWVQSMGSRCAPQLLDAGT